MVQGSEIPAVDLPQVHEMVPKFPGSSCQGGFVGPPRQGPSVVKTLVRVSLAGGAALLLFLKPWPYESFRTNSTGVCGIDTIHLCDLCIST